jgi:hypothetical protein
MLCWLMPCASTAAYRLYSRSEWLLNYRDIGQTGEALRQLRHDGVLVAERGRAIQLSPERRGGGVRALA